MKLPLELGKPPQLNVVADVIQDRVKFMSDQTIQGLEFFIKANEEHISVNHQRMLELLDRLDKYTIGG